MFITIPHIHTSMAEEQDDLTELSGVGPATAEKLREAGFKTYEKIAASSPGELSSHGGLGDDTANKAIGDARELLDMGGFQTGTEKLQEMGDIETISLIADSDSTPEDPNIVDALLGRGIETNCITEIHGEFGAGKSQMTHQLCVNVQLAEEYGGMRRGSMFIDTEDTFRPERIDDMVRGLDDEILENELEHRGIEGGVDDEEALTNLVESFLDNIHTAKAYNSNHQIALADKNAMQLADDLSEDPNSMNIGLVVVDSLTAHFRAEYVGRGTLAKRQQLLSGHLNDLDKLSDVHNCAVVYTNQVTANPDAFFGKKSKPIGGNILAHKARFRIEVKKAGGEDRICHLMNSPHRPDGEAPFKVTGDGVVLK